jgi:hypothetical protein
MEGGKEVFLKNVLLFGVKICEILGLYSSAMFRGVYWA